MRSPKCTTALARTRALALFRFIHTRTPALNRPQKPFRVAWTDRWREKERESPRIGPINRELLHSMDMLLALLIEGMRNTMWLFDSRSNRLMVDEESSCDMWQDLHVRQIIPQRWPKHSNIFLFVCALNIKWYKREYLFNISLEEYATF